MGLAAASKSATDSICRGIHWLVKNQNGDGSWTEEETTGTGFPKVFYLRYDSYRLHFPLLALAACRDLLSQETSSSA
jgi:squalene-hopene/tetraprenyl-beta-curcumene cyclase